MTNVEALKALYAALGGDPADVADAVTIVDVLNAIAAKYEGADDATINPDAIANIAAVAENIGGGGDNNAEFAATPETFTVKGNLKTLAIPEGVTSINQGEFGGGAFKALETVIIPESVTAISQVAFANCDALKNVTIPESVTSIEMGAFNPCKSLESIELPEALESIGMIAFAGCIALKSIVIPENVTSIGDYAFQNCTALETITINKAEGSISGAPWSAPETTQIIWNG